MYVQCMYLHTLLKVILLLNGDIPWPFLLILVEKFRCPPHLTSHIPVANIHATLIGDAKWLSFWLKHLPSKQTSKSDFLLGAQFSDLASWPTAHQSMICWMEHLLNR